MHACRSTLEDPTQIAWDGSQKLPIRLGATIADALAAGRPLDRLAVGVATWIGFVRRQTRAGAPIVDPLNESLARAAELDGAAFLEAVGVFPPSLVAAPEFRRTVEAACQAMGEGRFADLLDA